MSKVSTIFALTFVTLLPLAAMALPTMQLNQDGTNQDARLSSLSEIAQRHEESLLERLRRSPLKKSSLGSVNAASNAANPHFLEQLMRALAHSLDKDNTEARQGTAADRAQNKNKAYFVTFQHLMRGN